MTTPVHKSRSSLQKLIIVSSFTRFLLSLFCLPGPLYLSPNRAVFTWLSKGIGFGFGFGFTTPFGWLVYLLWFWFYDSQVKTALSLENPEFNDPNQGETAVHGCHCLGDMGVSMCKVQAIPHSQVTYTWPGHTSS